MVVLVTAASWLLTSCNRADAPNDAPPTTADVTTTTASPAAVAPPIIDTGENFDAIVRSLIAFNDWVVAHPDPSLLLRSTDSSCPCFAGTQKNLADLASKGWHYDEGRRTEVLSVRPERVGDAVVDAFVVLRSEEARVLDRAGQVVDREPAYPPTSYFYTLRRGPEGRWRITGIEYGSVL